MTVATPPLQDHDRVFGFAIPARDSRGRVVRLGPLLDAILAAHAYPPVLAACLAEALVLCALMGSLLKGRDDQLTLQAQSEDGPVRLLVADWRAGALRGYCEPRDGMALPEAGEATLEALFGSGHLAITFDIAENGQRYQGIVPLEGASLAAAVERYFAASEQLPTLVRVAIALGADGAGGAVAGGLLLQHLPEGEEGRERLHVRLDHPEWEHVSIMGGSVSDTELADRGLQLEEIVWRLFHEESEIRATGSWHLTRGCRCSVEHFETVLARFPKQERRDMANDDGIIVVDCAFCSKLFEIQD